jgi:hypothetical protein
MIGFIHKYSMIQYRGPEDAADSSAGPTGEDRRAATDCCIAV